MANNLTVVAGSYNGSGKFSNSFNGGYAIVNGVISASTFCVSAWVKRSGAAAVQIAVGKAEVFWFGIDGSGNAYASIGAQPGNRTITTTVNINDGVWHHIELNVDVANIRLFVDGVQAGSDTTIPSYNYALNPFAIRTLHSSNTPVFGWTGEVDDVAVYSAVQHTANFTAPTSAVTNNAANLISVWHLDGDGLDSMGAADPSNITLTGPSSGSQNVASSNFTVGYTGTITGTVTVTPTDSSGQGTFNPSTVQISEASPTATFTYTPTTLGARNINCTNNGSMGNPANVVYTATAGVVSVAVTDSNWFWSPYTWHKAGGVAKSVNPGSYFRIGFTGTSIEFGIDTSSLQNASVNSGWYPRLAYSVDGGALVETQLTPGQTALTISGLAAGSHAVILYYLRGWVEDVGGEAPDRWTTPDYCVAITGASIESGASTVATTPRAKNMIFYGDSIAEGVRAENNTVQPTCMNAKETVPHILAAALNAEVGQVGFGGTNYAVGFNSIPAFNSSYDLYSAGKSRLSGGLLSPAPDYVCVWMGGNGGAALQSDVATAITNLKNIAPNAQILMMVPVYGTGRASISAAVTAYKAANPLDFKVHFIDTSTEMQDGLAANSVDGLHPTKAYNATLAVGYQDAITADFNTAIGIVWDGATSSGQLLTPIDAGPTTLTHASYTDGDGNVWNLYRQERLLTTEQVWVE